MALFSPADRRFAKTVGELAHCNPFLPERIELERAALGDAFDPHLADWNARPPVDTDHENLSRLLSRCEQVLAVARDRIARGNSDIDDDLPYYEDLVLMVIYHRHRAGFDQLITAGPQRGAASPSRFYQTFREDAEHYLSFADRRLAIVDQLPHIFAGFFQIRRAFDNIFSFILGVSRPAMQLRSAVWESIFTHDMRRYRKLLFSRMADFTTLVIGPSGTGKELVARAVGLSRYIPFSEISGKFTEDFAGSFYAINLAALSPTLIESELFGHKRGSFTGAVADRLGWLEACPALGTVFLDEIGEVDPSIQIKLLRLLQSRTFSRLGETTPREFRGKIIAATNRDLAGAIQRGQFREDFYYRLCSDVIHVPALQERITDNPDELRQLVSHLVARMSGDVDDSLTDEVLNWIAANLGPNYPWPGNVRELEQCIRNVMIRKAYTPRSLHSPATNPDIHDELVSAMLAGDLTADELLRRYCTLVYAQTGSYESTAKILKLDRRTVRAKVDADLLTRLTRQSNKAANSN